MGRLTAAQRRRIPKDKYGLPEKKAYPMPDRGHAANAKARASEMENMGKLSKAQVEEIDRKADAILGKSDNDEDDK